MPTTQYLMRLRPMPRQDYIISKWKLSYVWGMLCVNKASPNSLLLFAEDHLQGTVILTGFKM